MIPLLVLWGLMAIAVLVLAIMRKMAAKDESEVIHVDDTSFEAKQVAIAARLEKIDHWGKITTVVAAVFGLVLLGIYLYNVWQQGSTIQ
jgi:hypothetical protein